jgi:TMEM175 potassium channel family protein
VLPLRFAADRPLLHGTRLRYAADDGNGRGPQQVYEFLYHLRDRQRHGVLVGIEVTQGIAYLLGVHGPKFTTLNPRAKPTRKPDTGGTPAWGETVKPMNRSRFENGSDGVFAIAITLLVLGLAVPLLPTHAGESILIVRLVALWPNFLAYCLSFAVIGIMWNNHHMLFRTVERLDRTTWLINLVLLGITAFIPFATAVLGEYSTQRPAAVLYGLTLTAASITYNALLHYLIRKRMFRTFVTQNALRGTVFHYRVGLTVYVAATIIAFIVPVVSFALYWAITLYYLFPRGVDADLPEAAASGNP